MNLFDSLRQNFGGAASAPLDMHEWRERVLSAILAVALVMGTLTAVPSMLLSLKEGRHALALVDAGALAWVVFMWRRRGLSFRFRAISLLAVLYVVGCVLLVTVGAVAQIYLMAFPVMAALLLGTRPAMLALLLNGLTLPLAGYLSNADFRMEGFDGAPWQKWIIITANFMFIDALITVSCSALLKGLERSLDKQRQIARSLHEGQVQLSAANEELQRIASQVPGMVYRVRISPNGERRYTFVSPGVRTLFGLEPQEVVADAQTLNRFVHPDDAALLRRQQSDIQDCNQNQSMDLRALVEGHLVWLQVTFTQHQCPDGSVIRNGVVMDITERKLAENAMRDHEARWKLALESSGDGVWDLDLQQDQIVLSARLREMCGYEADDRPEPMSRFRERVHPDDLASMRDAQQAHIAGRTPTFINEHRLRCRDGSWKWILARGMIIARDAGGRPLRLIGTHTDISSRKASEAMIWQQANYDGLTGLPNRQMLRDRLTQDIKQCHRDGLSLAVMFIDLDRFKEVNDTLGHDHGDLLLVEAARRINACVRDTDTVARLGGDEFTVVLSNLWSHERVAQIAQDIINAMEAVFLLGEERAYVSASVGITLYPHDATDIEDLFKQADQALYAAKDAGRSRFSHYTPALQEAALTRVHLANDLRDALAAQQFRVFYQPVLDFGSGEVVKAEALIRWLHPTRGWVSPALFIPIAESCGLIKDIGDWVFHEAAVQARRWRDTLHPEFQVSVNKSPLQFRNASHRQAAWFDHLRALGLPPHSMVVEITEGLLMDATAGVVQQLQELRDAGVQVALDDFGTGYSSLSYLQKFEIDVLKIDQAFVRGLTPTSLNLPLCKAIIVMAHEMGMKVVAEGVETAAQHALLKEAGCDSGQGFYYARPMPADEFDDWYAARDRGLTEMTAR